MGLGRWGAGGSGNHLQGWWVRAQEVCGWSQRLQGRLETGSGGLFPLWAQVPPVRCSLITPAMGGSQVVNTASHLTCCDA